MTHSRLPARRRFLHLTAGLSAASLLAPRVALASVPGARALSLSHTHTGERLELVYAMGDQVLPDAQFALNRFLRDHYSGDVGNIDPKLFGLLSALRGTLGADRPFEVISGYRSPFTNERLRKTRGGGVARHSLHMDGMAIDIRLPGVPLADLRDAAVSLQTGGVGIYERENFLHVDTGRVRQWG
ncbi:YcbK family protein [Cupriavidus campinensis]